jgi:DNA-binding NarL/FixJ family response regulator
MAKKVTAKKAKPQAEPQQAKVYIVDDHPLFREGLAAIIRQRPELCICGEAESAAQAFEGIRTLRPDILLTDIGLPGKSGLELLKDIRAFRPSLPVLVISMHDEILYAERVLKAGGRGYIMKQEGPDKILDAIATVLRGRVYLSGRMSAEILEQIASPGARAKHSPIGKLTDREFEVLQLIGGGKNGREIAKDLSLSIKTVNCHQSNIREKLGLKSAAAVLHFAAQWMVGDT